jgi:hypothetical protein
VATRQLARTERLFLKQRIHCLGRSFVKGLPDLGFSDKFFLPW